MNVNVFFLIDISIIISIYKFKFQSNHCFKDGYKASTSYEWRELEGMVYSICQNAVIENLGELYISFKQSN